MGALNDISEPLDKVPIWKRLKEAPAKIDALEERVAALEKRLEKTPGDSCPACGELQMRTDFCERADKGWYATQRDLDLPILQGSRGASGPLLGRRSGAQS